MPAIQPVGAPLRNIPAKLQDIAVTLGTRLAAGIFKAGVTANVSQPHAGDFLFTGQPVDVLGIAQTIVQAGVKHRVSGCEVGNIGSAFRTHGRLFRVDDGNFRSGVGGRLWLNDRGRGIKQIPVSGLRSLSTLQGVVITPGNNTPGLHKLAVREAIDVNHFNPCNGFITATAGVIDGHPSRPGGISLYDQLIG